MNFLQQSINIIATDDHRSWFGVDQAGCDALR